LIVSRTVAVHHARAHAAARTVPAVWRLGECADGRDRSGE
jgi:hypothetical protein